jgi:transglutaminase-like putative cysteine protease
MHLRISHLTRYSYDAPTPYGLQQLRLTPQTLPGQRVLSWKTEVEGGETQAEFRDQHDNVVLLVSLETQQTTISVRSEGDVETADLGGVLGEHRAPAPLWLYQRSTPLTLAGPGVHGLVRGIGNEFDSEVARLHALCAHLATIVRYDLGGTDSNTTAEAAISAGVGVCQDHANVFVAAARAMGFPARYVSGYLMMRDRVDQEASHAWAEAHVPNLGWVGFDASNGISPDACYVRLATGLDSAEAAPIRGVMMGHSSETMNVTLQVQQQ